MVRSPQQAARFRAGRLPVVDLLAGGAALGAVALWGLALHLIGG